jgi:hypothetical protein
MYHVGMLLDQLLSNLMLYLRDLLPVIEGKARLILRKEEIWE